MSKRTSQTNFLLEDNSPITLPKFQEIFDELMSRTWEYKGRQYNLKELGWTWGYSKHKRSLGVCEYTGAKGTGRVEISKYLLESNIDSNPKYFEDTIRHEIAHAIDFCIRDKSAHDYVWKDIAVAVGAVPKRSSKNVKKPLSKYTGVCAGGHEHSRHRLTAKGRRAACAKCCDEKNNGRYSPDYLIEWTKNF